MDLQQALADVHGEKTFLAFVEVLRKDRELDIAERKPGETGFGRSPRGELSYPGTCEV